MEFVITEDRSLASCLIDSHLELLRKHNATKKKAIERINFCGLLVVDELCIVSLPRASMSSCDIKLYDNVDLASLMLRTLNRYFESEDRKPIGESIDESSKNSLSQLRSILDLLYDYVANGLYSKSMKINKRNTAKINWKRTIKSELPIVDQSNSVIYLNLHSDLIRNNSKSIISLIHAEVVRKIDKCFGWFLSGSNTRIAQELDSIPSAGLSKEHMIRLLRRELNDTYSDREVRLLNNIINFISGTFEDGNDGNEIVAGISRFDYAWEDMLKATLPHTIKVNDRLPKPVVSYLGGTKSQYLKGMITDIVCKKDTVISTVDAKYYRASEVSNSPSWPDIVKQLFYVNAMKILFPHHAHMSWFIFPGKHPLKNNGPLSMVSIEMPVTKKPASEIFPCTHFAYFCPLEVMSMYCNYKKYSADEVDFLFSNQ